MSARAGWFPDPAGRPQHYRWWDGSAWTRFLTTDPTAPTPEPAAAPIPSGDPAAGVPPARQQPARHQAADPAPWQRAGAVVAAETSAAGSRPPGYERPSRPDQTRQLSLKPALLGTGAVALIAVIVLAIVLFGHPAPKGLEPPPPPDDSSGATSPMSSAAAPPTGGGSGPDATFDPLTRVFSIDGLTITLPAPPYAITRPSSTDLGGPRGGARADAVVHRNYNGRGSDWDATVEVDQVGPTMGAKNLDQTADKILSSWAASAFAGSRATIKNEKTSTITKGEPRPAHIVTADFHYKVKGVQSSYDHVSLLVTKGPSGNYVAFISSRPGDAGPKIKKALQDSINTIRLR